MKRLIKPWGSYVTRTLSSKIVHRGVCALGVGYALKQYVQSHNAEIRAPDATVDLLVIGGGSGGIAAAKRAAELGAKVLLIDYVGPSNTESTRNPKLGAWDDVGGTCLHVGCIPKKLWHEASLKPDQILESDALGWDFLPHAIKQHGSHNRIDYHNWQRLVTNVQAYITNMSNRYGIDIAQNQIPYIRGRGTILDPNTVQIIDKDNKEFIIGAKNIIIATGSRPKFPEDIQGAKKYGISSDDLFSLREPPGKTLIVGGSYIALETAGILAGLGYAVTVMNRTRTALRDFDQTCVNFALQELFNFGAKLQFEHRVLSIDEKNVVFRDRSGNERTEQFDTVMFATGRTPATSQLGLENVNIRTNENGKIIVDDEDRTNVPNIYAIGDVSANGHELTPVAIHSGRLLASRLFGSSTVKMDYTNVPTTVFMPTEFASVGLSEKSARELYGNNIEVYNRVFKNIQSTGFVKMVTRQSDGLVLGFHFVGEHAGEVVQGVAVAIKAGVTKSMFDSTVGIHPTGAGIMTNLRLGETSDFTC